MTLLQNLWPSRGCFAIGVLFAILALVACGTPQSAQLNASMQPAQLNASMQPAQLNASMQLEKVAAGAQAAQKADLPKPVKVGALETPVQTYPEPSHITGLDSHVLSSLLGQPGFMRRDAPAEIWQYKTLACTLDIFLYKDPIGPAYRVTHFEARGEAVTMKDCVVSVVKAAHNKPTG